MQPKNQQQMERPERKSLHNPTTNDNISILRSPVEGNGVFAKKRLNDGERIAFFEGDPTPHNTRHSLTLEGQNIEPTGELKHLNHSCDPNAYFLKRWLIAGRDIKEGDEITIDYVLTEDSFSYPFPCNCRSENCRRHIQYVSLYP